MKIICGELRERTWNGLGPPFFKPVNFSFNISPIRFFCTENVNTWMTWNPGLRINKILIWSKSINMKRNFRAHYLRKEEQYSTAISWATAQVLFALLQSALFSLRDSRNIKKVQRDIKNDDIDIDVFEGAMHLHKLEDKTLLNSVMYSPKLSRK